MARSLSSQKRLRQSLKRAEGNKALRSHLKTSIRKVNYAIVGRDAEAAEKAYREAARVLDSNAAHRIIHPNTAARRKSRLAKHINALVAAARK